MIFIIKRGKWKCIIILPRFETWNEMSIMFSTEVWKDAKIKTSNAVELNRITKYSGFWKKFLITNIKNKTRGTSMQCYWIGKEFHFLVWWASQWSWNDSIKEIRCHCSSFYENRLYRPFSSCSRKKITWLNRWKVNEAKITIWVIPNPGRVLYVL